MRLWKACARVESLLAHQRLIDTWAANCPENFENRAALVGAEIARIEGRDPESMRLYETAIRSARANGFVHNEALANEVARAFLHRAQLRGYRIPVHAQSPRLLLTVGSLWQGPTTRSALPGFGRSGGAHRRGDYWIAGPTSGRQERRKGLSSSIQ